MGKGVTPHTVLALDSNGDVDILLSTLFVLIFRVGFGDGTGLLSPGSRQLSEKVMAEVDREVQVRVNVLDIVWKGVRVNVACQVKVDAWDLVWKTGGFGRGGGVNMRDIA